MSEKKPVLKASHLGIQFGGLKAVDDFNMEIGESELIGLIGPNGAGKTTVFNLLTGVYQPTEGAFYLCGEKERSRIRWLQRALHVPFRTFGCLKS